MLSNYWPQTKFDFTLIMCHGFRHILNYCKYDSIYISICIAKTPIIIECIGWPSLSVYFNIWFYSGNSITGATAVDSFVIRIGILNLFEEEEKN